MTHTLALDLLALLKEIVAAAEESGGSLPQYHPVWPKIHAAIVKATINS
jgi:hypothetical protein